MPRYEFSEGTSNKFWQIDLNGSSFTTTFGKIGTAGQTSTKNFASDAKAQSEYTKLIAEKTKKGYQLVGAPSTPSPGVPTPRPAPAPKPTPAPAPASAAEAPAATAPASTAVPSRAPTASVSSTEPSVVMTDAAKRAADKEIAALAIKPRKADNPIGEWLTNVYRPFVEISKSSVKNGSVRGNPESQRLSGQLLREYGSLERMPAKLDVETAAAALHLAVLTKGYNATNEALLTFWAAHSGIGFAIEAFAASLQGWESIADSSARWLIPAGKRTLHQLFANRADLTLHAHWLGASEEQRTEARAQLEALRQGGDLLVRSAIASCVLDPAWIDADLREHATTGARAMFSPEALLVAKVPADIAMYLNKQTDEDQDFYTGMQAWGRRQRNAAVSGYSYVQRFGLAGVDLVCARIARIVTTFAAEPAYATGVAATLRELLEVARLGHNYPPVVTAALSVIDAADDRKLTKDEDPRSVAYDCLRSSPTISLPLVQAAGRKGWAKNLLPQLERLAGAGDEVERPEAPDVAVPAALRIDGGKFKAPEFWQPAALPKIVLHEGTVLAADHLPRLAAVLKAGDRAVIDELKQISEPASLAQFGWDLFQAWLTGGANSKDKWAFTALGLLGTDETARRITPLIRAWPGESQHARAVLGLDVLGDIGSDVALMMLNGIAQKVKFKGLQERARDKMDEIAQKRGMTAEQLADRLVPDLDLEDDGSKTLDFGPRSFRVGFDEALGPFVVDATGTRLKDLPKPNSKDDPALGAEATETWKAMKKDVRALAGIQLMRLELAMGNSRRWSGEEFRNFFVEHPLLTHLVRRLVWGVYTPAGTLQWTFRVAEDRSYADQGDDACTVDGSAVIGIVHRLHLPDDDVAAWGKLFGDYELAQPFEQLSRATYRLEANELGGTELTRFNGRVVETKKLLGLLSRGWRKGPAQDAGGIHELYKPIRADLIASLPIDSGLNAGGMDYVDPTQTLGSIDFSPTVPSWGNRTDAVPLSTLDEVVLSEIIRDVESMGAGAAE